MTSWAEEAILRLIVHPMSLEYDDSTSSFSISYQKKITPHLGIDAQQSKRAIRRKLTDTINRSFKAFRDHKSPLTLVRRPSGDLVLFRHIVPFMGGGIKTSTQVACLHPPCHSSLPCFESPALRFLPFRLAPLDMASRCTAYPIHCL